MNRKAKKRAATAGAVVMTHSTTPSRRAAKRRATLGAGLLVLGVLHLSTKDASGQDLPPAPTTTTTACVDEYHGPDGTVEEIPCGEWSACPGVMFGWKVPTKYYPDRCPPPTKPSPHPTNTVATVQPPMQGTPTVTLVGPVSIVATGPVDPPTLAVDTPPTTIIIEEDDPRWDCHTMGNHRCGPPVSATPKLALPATS